MRPTPRDVGTGRNGCERRAALEDRLLSLGDGRPPLEVNGRRAVRWNNASGAIVWDVRIAEGATLVGDDAWVATDPGEGSGGEVSTID